MTSNFGLSVDDLVNIQEVTDEVMESLIDTTYRAYPGISPENYSKLMMDKSEFLLNIINNNPRLSEASRQILYYSKY